MRSLPQSQLGDAHVAIFGGGEEEGGERGVNRDPFRKRARKSDLKKSVMEMEMDSHGGLKVTIRQTE